MKKKLIMICIIGAIMLSGCRNEKSEDTVFGGTSIEMIEEKDQKSPVNIGEEDLYEQDSLEEIKDKSVEDFDALLAGITNSYVMEGCEEANYGYYDVNNDGEDELVILTVRGITIFMYQDDEIKEICRYSYSVLLDNGIVWYHRPGAAPLHDYYQAFCLQGTEYQRVCTFEKYDDDFNGYFDENGKGDKYFYNGEVISKGEWDELIQPYVDCEEAALHDTGVIKK